MKNQKFIYLVYLIVLTATPCLSQAVSTPAGQLTFGLKTAGDPVIASRLKVSSSYETLDKLLQTSLGDGPKVLNALRELDTNILSVSIAVDDAVEKAIDPQHKYDHFNEFSEAPENAWMWPLFNYAEGNDADDEQRYVTMNRALRDDMPDSDQVTKWVTETRQAMWRMPRFEGISFRGTRLSTDRIDKHFPLGQLALDSAFISTSLFSETAFKFANPSVSGEEPVDQKIAVVIVIRGKTGRPVSAFTLQHTHEQEILFANGTPMIVVGKSPIFTDTVLGKTQIIVLNEK